MISASDFDSTLDADLVEDFRRAGYELIASLGAGGMGTVYKARHVPTGGLCALKMLHAGSPDLVPRFLLEVRVQREIRHPNVAHVYDFGKTPGGRLYYTMELLEGATLRQVCRSWGGPLPLRWALSMTSDMLCGLSAAHAINVLHRDIKPQNIFMTTSGTVKLLDFGVAKSDDMMVEGKRPTASGMFVGTPSHAAREVRFGGRSTVRSDVYSAGIVLWELLVGRVPTEQEILVSGVPGLEDAGRSDAPRRLRRAVKRATSAEPAERHPSVDALLDDLRAVLKDLPTDDGLPPRFSFALLPPPPDPALQGQQAGGATSHGGGKTLEDPTHVDNELQAQFAATSLSARKGLPGGSVTLHTPEGGRREVTAPGPSLPTTPNAGLAARLALVDPVGNTEPETSICHAPVLVLSHGAKVTSPPSVPTRREEQSATPLRPELGANDEATKRSAAPATPAEVTKRSATPALASAEAQSGVATPIAPEPTKRPHGVAPLLEPQAPLKGASELGSMHGTTLGAVRSPLDEGATRLSRVLIVGGSVSDRSAVELAGRPSPDRSSDEPFSRGEKRAVAAERSERRADHDARLGDDERHPEEQSHRARPLAEAGAPASVSGVSAPFENAPASDEGAPSAAPLQTEAVAGSDDRLTAESDDFEDSIRLGSGRSLELAADSEDVRLPDVWDQVATVRPLRRSHVEATQGLDEASYGARALGLDGSPAAFSPAPPSDDGPPRAHVTKDDDGVVHAVVYFSSSPPRSSLASIASEETHEPVARASREVATPDAIVPTPQSQRRPALEAAPPSERPSAPEANEAQGTTPTPHASPGDDERPGGPRFLTPMEWGCALELLGDERAAARLDEGLGPTLRARFGHADDKARRFVVRNGACLLSALGDAADADEVFGAVVGRLSSDHTRGRAAGDGEHGPRHFWKEEWELAVQFEGDERAALAWDELLGPKLDGRDEQERLMILERALDLAVARRVAVSTSVAAGPAAASTSRARLAMRGGLAMYALIALVSLLASTGATYGVARAWRSRAAAANETRAAAPVPAPLPTATEAAAPAAGKERTDSHVSRP